MLKSVEERLQASKVSDQFEDPQNPHDPDKPDHLPCLPDDLKVLKPLEDQREVEGDDGKKIDQVHGTLDEFKLVGADDQTDEILQGEEDHNKVINEINDVGEYVEFYHAIVILLEFLSIRNSLKVFKRSQRRPRLWR